MADRLDDLICAFHPDTSSMETLGILLLGWIIFLTFLTLVGKFIYSKVTEAPPPVPVPPIETKNTPTAPPTGQISDDKKAAVLEALKQPSLAAKKLGTRGRSKSRETSREPSREREAPLPDAVTGPDEVSVKWVNDIVHWLKTHPKVVEDLKDEWRNGLNESTRECESESGVLVEVSQVVFNEAPTLRNVFVECSPADNVTDSGRTMRPGKQTIVIYSNNVYNGSVSYDSSAAIFRPFLTVTCDVFSNFALCVRARRSHREKSTISDYRVKIEPLRARMNVAFITEESRCIAKFDGWPEIAPKLVLATSRESLPKDEIQIQDIVLETLTTAVRRSTMTLLMTDSEGYPKFERPVLANEPILPVHYDSMMQNAARKDPLISAAPGKKLLVKIIKAAGLGTVSKSVVQKFACVIEMDDPPQRHQTTIKEGTTNPFWEEQFLFDLRPTTAEILFEVEERTKNYPEFLGLGIVGIEELLMHPSQRQIIQLQARPYENDPVSGHLTVEFLFVDGNAALVDRKSQVQTKKSASGNLMTTSKLIFSRNPDSSLGSLFSRKKQETISPEKELSYVNGSDPVTETALRELRQRKVYQDEPTAGATKSTLIIHSVQKKTYLPTVVDNEGPLAAGDVSPHNDLLFTLGAPNAHDSTASSISSAGETNGRGRARYKHRGSFFRQLRDRLSRSKNRSKSMEPGYDQSISRDSSLTRSQSADRANRILGGSASASNLLVVPGTNGMKEADSSRSLSTHSNISNSSQRTFIDANSMLVLETVEAGVTKHYLVPLTLAEKKRTWGRKGTKLHIFNDHIFVAKHLPGGTCCDVCKTSVYRRLGKQGYECRDCQLKCHKPCHVKTETLCPLSTVHHLELEYIQDAPPVKKV